VFFFSYIQVAPKEGEALWSNAEEMCKVNSKLGITINMKSITNSNLQHLSSPTS